MITAHDLRAFARRIDVVTISGTSGMQRQQLRGIARDLYRAADDLDYATDAEIERAIDWSRVPSPPHPRRRPGAADAMSHTTTDAVTRHVRSALVELEEVPCMHDLCPGPDSDPDAQIVQVPSVIGGTVEVMTGACAVCRAIRELRQAQAVCRLA